MLVEPGICSSQFSPVHLAVFFFFIKKKKTLPYMNATSGVSLHFFVFIFSSGRLTLPTPLRRQTTCGVTRGSRISQLEALSILAIHAFRDFDF